MSEEVSIFLTQYRSGDKIEKNKIGRAGWASSTCGGEGMRVQGFGGEIGGKETTWKTQAWMGG